MKLKLPFLGMLLFLLCVQALKAQPGRDLLLSTSVTYNTQDQSLGQVLDSLERRFGVQVFYREEWLPREPVNQNFVREPLEDVFKNLLYPVQLDFIRYDATSIIVGRRADLLRLEDFSYESFLSTVAGLDEGAQVVDVSRVVRGDSNLRPLPIEATLVGTVYDLETEEPLPGAQITVPDARQGGYADSLGRYEITLPTGTWQVFIEASGREKRQVEVTVFSNDRWDIPLAYTAYSLDEVLVEANNDGQSTQSVQVGKVELSARKIRQIPALLGEADVVNAILQLPGVSNTGDGASGFNVRGGNVDQNLIMQEGNVIFNSNHLFGFYSVFNPDMIKRVTLYKGHIPAEYGGRTSSVLDVEMEDGSFRNLKGRGSLGLFSSRLSFQGPIIKDKTSFIISGRGAYPSFLTQYVERNRDVRLSSAYYADGTAKITQKLGEGGKLSLFGYWSTDFFRFAEDLGFSWQNFSAGLKWQQILTEKVSLRVQASRGSYASSFFTNNSTQSVRHDNGVDHWRGSTNLQIVPSRSHNINLGVDGTLYDMRPDERTPFNEESVIQPFTAPKDQGLELGAYISDEFDLGNYLRFYVGVRASYFQARGPATVFSYTEGLPRIIENVADSTVYGPGDPIETFQNIEPRVSARIRLNETSSFKLSYNRLFQYVHLLSNTASATPIDLWQISNTHFPDQRSDNYSLGFFKDFDARTWQTSIEFFYRDMTGLVVARDFASFLGNAHIETEVLNAVGQSYGAELRIKRELGKLDLELGATYARTFRRTVDNPIGEFVNRGEWFPADFDTPININISARYKPRVTRTFSVNFTYRSGRPVTVPTGVISIYPSWDIPVFSDRNQFRIPAYHRLDIAYTFDDGLVSRRRFKTDLTFSIYNLYGRANPFSVFFRKEGREFKAFQLSILGTVLPFISYNFRF